ncbi:hypothetical protein [Sphingobium sp.]|uniref:hypothetical protein n=1 Tax=Sphingobium sp. TaxID=1912891 RepID=UPI002CE24604|nr:hypothetical protein [Sphingobium sp.]HUD92893.1 hypothetical protein [Sphingobium sp.]
MYGAVGHDSEQFLAVQPVRHLAGQTADYISIDGRIGVEEDVTAFRRSELPIPELIEVADYLLDRNVVKRGVREVMALQLLELENRGGVARLIIATGAIRRLKIEMSLRSVRAPSIGMSEAT